MPENRDDTVWLHYDATTFPYHADCYTWPKLTIPGTDDILNVHCIRDMDRLEFVLMGFIDIDPDEQISAVIYLAKQMGPGSQVIMFKGIGLDDAMMTALMERINAANEALPMEELGGRVGMLHVAWPTRFQNKVLREAKDMSRHGNFHETSLAYRLKATPEEIHYHLEVLTDIGLMARE